LGSTSGVGSAAMMVESIAKTQLARELAYVGEDGNPSCRAIAQLLRDALGRWGLSPKRAVLKYARDQLRAGDLPADGAAKVLDRLVARGECAGVVIGYESYVAPAEPRWIT